MAIGAAPVQPLARADALAEVLGGLHDVKAVHFQVGGVTAGEPAGRDVGAAGVGPAQGAGDRADAVNIAQPLRLAVA